MSTLFSLMLVGMSLGQVPPPVQPFRDVPKTHWAYAAVTDLRERGILKGYPGYYGRSTPYAALQSLVEAIQNDDDAMVHALTSSEWREDWIERLKKRYPDAREREGWMREFSENWLHSEPYSGQDWQSFNAEAQKARIGIEQRFSTRRIQFTFVREPAGWKIVRMHAGW